MAAAWLFVTFVDPFRDFDQWTTSSVLGALAGNWSLVIPFALLIYARRGVHLEADGLHRASARRRDAAVVADPGGGADR